MTESARSVVEIVALCSLLGIIILSAIFGNTLVCVAVYRSSTLRSQVSNIFIVNLAMTDFFNAVLVMPATFISLFTNRWVLSEYWCDGVCFLNYCFIIVSMWTLGLVSLDRYFAVVQPFRYTAIVTNTRACVALACTWFLGFIFASPPVFMQWVWYDNLEAICAINWEANTRQVVAYTLTAFAVCFCVPAIVMSFAYAGIYRVARRQTRRIQAEIDQVAQSIAINEDVDAQHENTACTSERSDEDVSNQNTRNKRKRTTNNNDRKQPRRKGKAVRTIVTMVAVFFFCLTPFCITKVLKAVYVDNFVVGVWINTIAALLAFSNSCCNPIIYSITRQDFRSAFASSLRCLRRNGSVQGIITNGAPISFVRRSEMNQ